MMQLMGLLWHAAVCHLVTNRWTSAGGGIRASVSH